MKIETVLFDFDLTLINLKLVDSTDWMKVRKEVASYYNANGVPASVTTRYELPLGLYEGIHRTQRGKFQPEKFSAIQKKASELLKEKYEEKGLRNAVRIPGAKEILKWVKERDLNVGVVSLNSEKIIKKVAEKKELKDYIDVFFGRDSPGNPKPSEDQIENCLKKFGSQPDEALMVGDSPSDVEVSNNAGVISVALEGDYYSKEELVQADPDYIIDNLRKLKKIESGE
ncbi:hypothetical protein AKJ63_01305 [candidate division MSBL1 archaeon SCGC-AAA259D18]|uniref:HAD family hydrolase n=1 Tax=candidate division MSBL1 archaeon SCGC-AAA259D18 TaxID=1698262 RepID=A0A133UBI5_9EURY|nr:hypothetical protein AKJ63_01305 [candidate division MSBL1 archaeon SCGC-AAA259D18]